MNRIKGSVIAKLAAWVTLLVSGACFIGSCILLAVMEDYQIFEMSQEEVLEREFAEVNDCYSAAAIKNVHRGSKEDNEKYFANKAFRYGIIEAESLEGLDLNREDTYLEKNFAAGNIKEEELYLFCLRVSQEANIWYSDELFGSWGYWTYQDDYESMYADRICYDTAEGIFYYRAYNQYYPIQDVSLQLQRQVDDTHFQTEYYTFQYDNDRKIYRNLYADNESVMDEIMEANETEETAELPEVTEEEKYTTVTAQAVETVEEETEEESNQTFEQPKVRIGSQEMEILHSKKELTFQIFDGTELEYTKWEILRFDGIRELDASELTLIDADKIPQSSFIEVEDAYLDEYYTLHILPKSDAKDYLVVSFVDKNELEAEKQAFLGGLEENSWEEKLEAVLFTKGIDLYVLKEVFLDTLYELKEDIFAFLFGMLFLSVVSFVFLICAAGHRGRKEEIVPAFLDKLPLDILFGAICFMELCGIGMIGFLMSENTSAVFIIPFGIGIGGILAGLLVLFVLSFAVRVKLGNWWRNSVIYWLFAKLRGLGRKIWQNLGIFWKAMIIPVIFCMAEIFFGFCAAGAEAWVVLLAVFFNGLLGMIFFLMAVQFYKLQEGSRMIAEGDLQHKIDTTRMFWEFKKHADNLNCIGDGMSHAVDERMKSERFKTELITNVSHDIKTPLTSIINYVDLLERTDISDETAKEYLEVLERQSARLKKLIEDLIEASKASTGNLSVNMEELEANVFLTQILGEFEGKIANAGLELIIDKPQEEIPILADGRHLWRVVDNLMNNICKYAQPCSRVYINLEQTSDKTLLIFKNMSKYALNITSDELMERFVRGDSSRNTEGNGLGLSIAKSLMELMDGKLLLYIDGDLFKVVLEFSQKA